MSKLLSSSGKFSAWLRIGLILVATWVRLWQFPDIPPAFNYDKAYNVIDTLWLRENSSFVAFLPGNTGRHALFHYLAIPAQLEPGDYRLVTGMYEASTGQRLVAIDGEGQPYKDNMIMLAKVRVLSDKIILSAP